MPRDCGVPRRGRLPRVFGGRRTGHPSFASGLSRGVRRPGRGRGCRFAGHVALPGLCAAGGGQDIDAAMAAVGEEGRQSSVVSSMQAEPTSACAWGLPGRCIASGLLAQGLDAEAGRPGFPVQDEDDAVIPVVWDGRRQTVYFQDGPYLPKAPRDQEFKVISATPMATLRLRRIATVRAGWCCRDRIRKRRRSGSRWRTSRFRRCRRPICSSHCWMRIGAEAGACAARRGPEWRPAHQCEEMLAIPSRLPENAGLASGDGLLVPPVATHQVPLLAASAGEQKFQWWL